MILKKENLIPILFFSLYCLTTLISNHGAIDKIAPQWLYLSIINLGGLLYLANNFENLKISISQVITNKSFILLSAFVLWGLLSYFYAINQVEVLVKFFRWINVVIALLVCSTLAFQLKNALLITSILFSIILTVELYFSYSPYFQIISLSEYNFTFANVLKGASANKNITAASILIKLPFVFYLLGKYKNTFVQFVGFIFIGSTTFMILLLSARASIISLIFIIAITILFKTIQFFKTKEKEIIKSTILLLIPIFLSICIFQVTYGSQNSASILNRVSTINSDDTSTQQRLRYYFHSLDQIKNNPIIGVGMGNWKIKSVEYDKEKMDGYIVPYHTHNDFLEFGAELGIIGFLLYLGIFLYIIKEVLIKLGEETHKIKFAPEALILLLGGVVYFIDANLNFPHARVGMQITFIFYIAMFSQLIKKRNSGPELE